MIEKNLNVVKNHWENPNTVSLKDENLQLIERFAIVEQLEKIKVSNLADIGCGNCKGTIIFSKYAEFVLEFIENHFEVVFSRFFSDYFFLTRIVGPLINNNEPYKHDDLFKKLSSFQLIEKQIGAQFLLVLKKI